MKEALNKIRQPLKISNKALTVFVSFLILVFGTTLGIFAKWLDNLSLDSDIWWHRIIERLDLGNVFSEMAIWLLIALAIAVFSFDPIKAAINVFLFFGGMCISYHLYTIMFAGFNPSDYMMKWYLITAISPVIGAVCWYAKSGKAVSIVISALIIYIMTVYCFSIGRFYFSFISWINTIIFAATAAVLYRTPKQLTIGLAAGIALAFLNPLGSYIYI